MMGKQLMEELKIPGINAEQEIFKDGINQ